MRDSFEEDLARLERELGVSPGGPPEEGASMTGGTPGQEAPLIIVIDDDPQIQETLADVLSDRYRVRVFRGGEEAMGAWEEGALTRGGAAPPAEVPPLEGAACVLLDIKMPGESGVTLYRKLQVLCPRLPVIFYTAYPGDEPRESLGVEPFAFLGKGCSLGELEAALKAALARRGKPPAPFQGGPS